MKIELKYPMKKTTIVILLSALVCPGAGHLFLKHTIRGIILILLFSVLLYPITNYAYQQTLLIYQEVLSGHIAPTMASIKHFMTQHPSDREQLQQLSLSSYALLILWLIGILDSYRLAKNQH